MSHQSAPPDVIYIIRHGEKPDDPAPRRAAPAHRGVANDEYSFAQVPQLLLSGDTATIIELDGAPANDERPALSWAHGVGQADPGHLRLRRT